jgi:hypothetical protein
MLLEEKRKKKVDEDFNITMQTAVERDIIMMTRRPAILSINDDGTAYVVDIWRPATIVLEYYCTIQSGIVERYICTIVTWSVHVHSTLT